MSADYSKFAIDLNICKWLFVSELALQQMSNQPAQDARCLSPEFLILTDILWINGLIIIIKNNVVNYNIYVKISKAM